MQVSIAKLGQSIQTVEVADAASVMDALKAAGYNLDSVLNVKKNGVVVTMGDALAADDILLVSQEKIKGGNETGILKLKFDIKEEEEVTPVLDGFLAYTTEQTTFEIVRDYLMEHGYSMNDFKRIVWEEGETVSISLPLTDGKSYTIVVE